MLGRAGVVKPWPAGSTLVVGEGLETVLAAATRIPFEGAPLTPAWATLSSHKLRILPVIPGVERLIVLVDNDANREGQTAAAHVAAVWRAAGRTVMPLLPNTSNTDFNDLVLQGDTHAPAV
jgi:Toprim domain